MMASLVKISRVLKGNNEGLLLDTKAFGLHILSFTLFIVAFQVYDIYFCNSLVNWSTASSKKASNANSFCTGAGFLSQMILMLILNKYSQI